MADNIRLRAILAEMDKRNRQSNLGTDEAHSYLAR